MRTVAGCLLVAGKRLTDAEFPGIFAVGIEGRTLTALRDPELVEQWSTVRAIWLALSFLRGFLALVQVFDRDGFFLLDTHGDMGNAPDDRHLVRVLECPNWFAGVRIRN